MCATYGGVRKHSWPCLTLTYLSLSLHALRFTQFGSRFSVCHHILTHKKKHLRSPTGVFSAFYSQRSVTVVWTIPSPWSIQKRKNLQPATKYYDIYVRGHEKKK